jgi:hypothetical protein
MRSHHAGCALTDWSLDCIIVPKCHLDGMIVEYPTSEFIPSDRPHGWRNIPSLLRVYLHASSKRGRSWPSQPPDVLGSIATQVGRDFLADGEQRGATEVWPRTIVKFGHRRVEKSVRGPFGLLVLKGAICTGLTSTTQSSFGFITDGIPPFCHESIGEKIKMSLKKYFGRLVCAKYRDGRWATDGILKCSDKVGCYPKLGGLLNRKRKAKSSKKGSIFDVSYIHSFTHRVLRGSEQGETRILLIWEIWMCPESS